jgi:6-pyruvoyltetrahydropterin/6-carboxytetrahydropterin synthase
MILNENDPAVPFLQEQGEPLFLLPDNPTAETISRLIYNYTKNEGFPVVEVSLWETPRSFATYRE